MAPRVETQLPVAICWSAAVFDATTCGSKARVRAPLWHLTPAMHVWGAQLGKGGRRHARQDLHRNRQGGSSRWSVWCSGQSAAPQAQVAHPAARCSSSVLRVRVLVRTSALAPRRAAPAHSCNAYNTMHAYKAHSSMHAYKAHSCMHASPTAPDIRGKWPSLVSYVAPCRIFIGVRRILALGVCSSVGHKVKRRMSHVACRARESRAIVSVAGPRNSHLLYFSCTCLFRANGAAGARQVLWPGSVAEIFTDMYVYACICVCISGCMYSHY